MAISLSQNKTFLTVSAFIELGAGLAFLGWPAESTALLTGESLGRAAAMTVARVAGAALLTLGIACWNVRNDATSSAKGLTVAMLFYDLAAAAVLSNAGLTLGIDGVLLWPAVVLHAVLSIWCVICLRSSR